VSVVVISVSGTPVTDDVLIATAQFIVLVNGSPGQCAFQVRDDAHVYSFTSGEPITLTIDGTLYWGGYITRARYVYPLSVMDTTVTPDTVSRYWSIEGVDYNILFQKRIVFKPSDPAGKLDWMYPVDEWDDTIINDIFDNYLDIAGDGLTRTDVQRIAKPILDIQGVTHKVGGMIASAGMTWGEAMSAVAKATGAVYYITPDKNLHYVDAGTVTSAYTLTDRPYAGGTVPGGGGEVVVFTDPFTRTEVGGFGAGYTVIDGNGEAYSSVNGSYAAVAARASTWTVVAIPHDLIYGPVTVQMDFWVQSLASLQASGWNTFYYFEVGHLAWQIYIPTTPTGSPMDALISVGPGWDDVVVPVDASSWYTVKATYDGSTSSAKIWKRGTTEPSAWQATDLGSSEWTYGMMLEVDALTNEEGAIDNLTISQSNLVYVDTFTRDVTRGLGGDWVWSDDDSRTRDAAKANAYVASGSARLPPHPDLPLTGDNYESFSNPGLAKRDAGVLRFDVWIPALVEQDLYKPAIGIVLDHPTTPVWTYVGRDYPGGWWVGPWEYQTDPTVTRVAFAFDPSTWYTIETAWDVDRNTEWRVWKQGATRPTTPTLSGQLTLNTPLNAGTHTWLDFWYGAVGVDAQIDNIYLWDPAP